MARWNHRRTLAALGLAGVLTMAAVRAWPSDPPPAALVFVDARERVYALDWQSKSDNQVLGEKAAGTDTALSGALTLQGSLVLASLGLEEGAHVVTARFEGLQRAELTLFGQTVLASTDDARAQLEGHRAQLRIKPDGAIVSVRMQAGAPPLFATLMQSLVRSLRFELREPTVNEWDGAGDGVHGFGSVHYTRTSSEPWSVRRERARYEHLEGWMHGGTPPHTVQGHAVLTLDRRGQIEAIEERETLEASDASGRLLARSSLRLTKQDERAAAEPPLEYRDAAQDEQPDEDPVSKRARLERRTVGFSLDALVEHLYVHAASPTNSELQWTWIARGYLELHPEKCAELLSRVAGADLQIRALAIDLLVSVGHEEAQRALVKAFSKGDGPEAPPLDTEQSYLLQHVGLVEQPSAALLDFVLDRYRAGKQRREPPAQATAAIALSGLIARLHDPTRARQLGDELVADLHDTTEPLTRAALLRALGNAALEGDHLTLRAAAHDDDATIRSAVALALRNYDRIEANITLLELAADADSFVQKNALLSLAQRQLGLEQLGRLAQSIERGAIDHSNYDVIVNLCAAQQLTPAANAVLLVLTDREDIDPQTRARALRVVEGEQPRASEAP